MPSLERSTIKVFMRAEDGTGSARLRGLATRPGEACELGAAAIEAALDAIAPAVETILDAVAAPVEPLRCALVTEVLLAL
jgi:hypothetical protein